MKIGIVGLGYVGLCTAVCFADRGVEVIGVDVAEGRLETINQGRAPFYERDIDSLIVRAISSGNLRCSGSYDSLDDSALIFITVGTPTLRDGSIDLAQVKSAAKNIAAVISRSNRFPVVIVKSTVIPGTTGHIVKPILEENSGKRFTSGFGLCSNPEFLREGSAIEDTLRPDRIVIGAEDEISAEKLVSLYKSYYGYSIPPIVRTDFASAELIKYANNAFLAMKVSYINSIARVCEKLPGADVGKVASAIGLDSRIGSKFLEAGPGYGGSCFPKDIRALVEFSRVIGAASPLFKAIEDVNAGQVDHVVSTAKKMLGGLRRRRICVLGLAFKAGTNDVRESPSIKVITRLLAEGAIVTVNDPKAMDDAKRLLGSKVGYSPMPLEAIKDTELCVIMTPWEEFKKLKAGDFVRLMKRAAILDTRRIYDPFEFSTKLNFAAVGQGGAPRPSSKR